jgi:hypothetical protein
MLKKRAVQLAKILIPVGLGIYLIWHIYRQLSADQRVELFNAFERANYFWVICSIAMGLLSHWIRGYRWSFQLEAMGYRSDLSNNFMAVMIGYIVNLALPRVGEVSRAAAIAKYEKIPFQKSFGSILSERTLDFIILMVISITTIFLQYDLLRSFSEKFLDAVGEKFTGTLFWLMVAGLVLLILGSIFVISRLSHLSAVNRLRGFIRELAEGLRSILRMKERGKYLLATIAIWLLYVGMFWVCFFALEETASLGANAIFAGFVLGSFAIVIIPGGIGAFPAGIMQSLVLYGIAEETGFALGWILWFSQTIMILLFGGASMLLMPIVNKRKNDVTPRSHSA